MTRSLGWMLVALGLGAFHPTHASAQDNPYAPLPAGATACKFGALVKPVEPGWWVIREVPRQDGREVGRLPAVDSTRSLAEVQVIGVKDGWFLIDGAAYPEADSPLYTGRGWVEGKAITTHLYRDTLRKAPGHDSPDVSHLYGTSSNGLPYQPYDLDVQGVLGCSGPWLEVAVHQPNARTVSGKPASTADGTVHGWTDRSCTKQSDGPCKGEPFDYPWSPLPAGVTECNFRALSNDPDPAGLNVRDAPDRNARVLGRLPPRDSGRLQDGSFIVRAAVQVLGYRKGWFLVEEGSSHDAVPPSQGPQPYGGRGWVAGTMLTAGLLHGGLKQAPNEKSADVIDLLLRDKEGIPHLEPHGVKLRPIIACSGDWVQVEVALEKGMTPLPGSGASKGAPRGWVNGTCAEQFVPCGYEHLPWSPPAPLPPD